MNRGDGNQTIAEECYDAAVEQLALYNMTRHDCKQPPLDMERLAKDVAIKQYGLTKQREENDARFLRDPNFYVTYGGPR